MCSNDMPFQVSVSIARAGVVSAAIVERDDQRRAGDGAEGGEGGVAKYMLTSDLTTARDAFEREALGELDALRVFALRLTRVRADAEDLVSDTLTRALERWEQYRLGTNIRAWLCTILYHLFVSSRRRAAAHEVSMDDEAKARALEAVGEPDPETSFYDSFLDDEIVRALDDLPDEYRAAVTLSDLQDLQYAEIARVLGIPEGTVKSRLFRGRRLLQRKLARYAMEMGYIRRRRAVVALSEALTESASGGSFAA